jgi:hypothetical protein
MLLDGHPRTLVLAMDLEFCREFSFLNPQRGRKEVSDTLCNIDKNTYFKEVPAHFDTDGNYFIAMTHNRISETCSQPSHKRTEDFSKNSKSPTRLKKTCWFIGYGAGTR